MPALRTAHVRASSTSTTGEKQKKPMDLQAFAFESDCDRSTKQSNETIVDLTKLASGTIDFPLGAGRAAYRRKDGKKVTQHQWAVYDYIMQIPAGRVTTYKQICDALGEGSPRSVGSALRNNPFAPYVPCHRVIASDLNLGGFMGEWGTEKSSGSRCAQKLDMLTQEGVDFTPDGKLKHPKQSMWASAGAVDVA